MESGYQDSSFRIALSKKFLEFLGNLFGQSPFLRNLSWVFFWEFNETESSHRRCSISKAVLENFTKFTGEHLCWSLFFNKAGSLSPLTLLKKRLTHSCFRDNFVKFLRTPFAQNTSGRLLQSETWNTRRQKLPFTGVP